MGEESKDDIKVDLNVQTPPSALKNELAKELINEEKENIRRLSQIKFSLSDVINSTIAISAIIALFLTIASLNVAKKSLELTKLSLDSSNAVSQKTLGLTEMSVRAAMKATAISDSNYKLSKLALQLSDSINNVSYKMSSHSLAIGEISLLESKKNNVFMRMSSINENRAFLTLSKLKILSYKIDSIIDVEAILLNVGKTPAYNVKSQLLFALAPNETYLVGNFPHTLDSVTETIVAGSQTFSPYGYILNEPTELHDSLLRKKQLFVFVMVTSTYRDIYNEKHFTHAYARYDYDLKRFAPCKMYNESN